MSDIVTIPENNVPDLKKVLHQIVNLPQRFFSEFFALAAQFDLRHEPRFSLIGDESMVSIKMYLPGRLIMEFRLGLSYPNTAPLFFVHAPYKNVSRQLQLDWNLQVEQKIDRLNFAMKKLISFDDSNKKAPFYFAYGNDGVAETVDEGVAARNNLQLMLTNHSLEGVKQDELSSSDLAPPDEAEKSRDISESVSQSALNGLSSEDESLSHSPMDGSFDITESANGSITSSEDESSQLRPTSATPEASVEERSRKQKKMKIRMDPKGHSHKRRNRDRLTSESETQTSFTDESASEFLIDTEASTSLPANYAVTGRRTGNRVSNGSPTTSEKGHKRRPQARDRSSRFSHSKELGYYLADGHGKTFQAVSMPTQNRPPMASHVARFKCKLEKVSLQSMKNNQKQELVFSFNKGKVNTLIHRTKGKKGGQINYNISESWKLRTTRPEKLDLLVQLKESRSGDEIGYVKINFLALATGPVTNKLEIISTKDLRSVEGIVTFDLEIREYFKKTVLKLQLSVDPAPNVKFDSGLYCQISHIEDYKKDSDDDVMLSADKRLCATTRPLMKVYSRSWSLRIVFPKASLKALRTGALFISLQTKPIKRNEIEEHQSAVKDVEILTLTDAYAAIALEDIFPSGYDDGVDFRATLKGFDKKSIVGDLLGVASWRGLPLLAQVEDGFYESKCGMVRGFTIKGALPPQHRGPLNTKSGLLSGTLEQLMASQKEKYPDLPVPYILYFLADIVENKGGLQTEGIFKHTFPANSLRETIWELQKGDFTSAIHPREAASLIKSWLKTIEEPIIPSKEYDQCLRNSSASPETLAQHITTFPKENQQILIFLIQLLRKVEQHKKITKMDFHNLAVVMAPCICRCPGTTDVFLQSIPKEVGFVENLLENLRIDTSRRKSRRR